MGIQQQKNWSLPQWNEQSIRESDIKHIAGVKSLKHVQVRVVSQRCWKQEFCFRELTQAAKGKTAEGMGGLVRSLLGQNKAVLN